jgi:hypothetical protein
MAEDKVEGREVSWQHLFPWTQLFRGFQIALDPNKLFLAAMGILAMTVGWLFLSLLFSLGWSKPQWGEDFKTRGGKKAEENYPAYKQALNRFNLMHETANVGPEDKFEVADFANNYAEFERLDKLYRASFVSEGEEKSTSFSPNVFQHKVQEDPTISEARARQLRLVGQPKPGGALARWPFFEDRGPNPYLLVTGRAKAWEKGGFEEWLITRQVPVLIEPLIKMFGPIAYLFDSRAESWDRFYFFLVAIWTLAVWSLFGGAITRIAAVQIARGEKIGMFEALAFTRKRLLSYLIAPVFPLLVIFVLLIFMVIYGFFFMIPILGDIFVAGLFWPFMLLFGLGIAIALVGLVGWPLMAATVSTEGTDSWEAFSRSYSYVFQRPWQYLWCGLVTIAYGAVVLFFIGFMGSLLVYLSKWGVSKTPWIDAADRNPSFLFVYAPTSFGWRDLLLSDAKAPNGQAVVGADGEIIPSNFNEFKGQLYWWNQTGAFLVSIWIYLVFLLVLGFGYAFFWGAMTITYMLLRRSVDTAEMEEVYLEEEDQEGYNGPLAPAGAPAAPGAKTGPTQMVEAPTLKTPAATAPTAPAATSSPVTAPAATEKPAAEPAPPAAEPKADGEKNSPTAPS